MILPKLVLVRFSLRCKLGRHDWYLHQGAFEIKRCKRCFSRDWSYPGDWPTVLADQQGEPA